MKVGAQVFLVPRATGVFGLWKATAVKREDGSVEETTLAPVVFVPLLSGTLD